MDAAMREYDGSVYRVSKRWFTAEGLAGELGGGATIHSGPWFVAVRLSAPRPPRPSPR